MEILTDNIIIKITVLNIKIIQECTCTYIWRRCFLLDKPTTHRKPIPVRIWSFRRFKKQTFQNEVPKVRWKSIRDSYTKLIWVFPKKSGTPKSSILKGFSIINPSILGAHLYFWKRPYSSPTKLHQPTDQIVRAFLSRAPILLPRSAALPRKSISTRVSGPQWE